MRSGRTMTVSGWVCSPDTVGGFSAVGYFFARQLHETTGVPIGMINNAWGGSACEAWINRETLAKDPQFEPLLARWSRWSNSSKNSKPRLTRARRNEAVQWSAWQMGGNARPGNIYNGVLKSHLGYGIRGAIWYQGESNAGRAISIVNCSHL